MPAEAKKPARTTSATPLEKSTTVVGSAPQSPQGQSSSLDVQGTKSYLLGPGDVLDVRVFGQPELSSNVQVDSDGNLIDLTLRLHDLFRDFLAQRHID